MLCLIRHFRLGIVIKGSAMNRLHTFHVKPSFPKKIERLQEIAMNLHWTWDHDAIDLFRRLDQELWRKVDQNPIRMFSEIKQDRLEEVANDDAFLSHLNRVWEKLGTYKKDKAWYQSEHKEDSDMLVAYFSAEFGIHECLPIYSGGLGILAGDHLKAASDIGLPLVGIGLLYQCGYFRQYLNADGWQQEYYPVSDTFNMPIELLRDDNGKPLQFDVMVGSHNVTVHIWQILVGRIKLLLLDTNVLSNHPEDRQITENLYGGDIEMRIRQEIVLGIGGMRALNLLNIKPTVFHMNEGHSAFLALERIRQLMAEEQLTFKEALEATRAANVFTTHTPVPAGIDKFGQDLVTKYFQEFWPQLGLDRYSFLAFGGADPDDPKSPVNMATLAINLSAYVNGVSKLHGEVSRKMWHHLWPEVSASEVPINSVTNGVHAKSWISPEMIQLLDRYIGPTWQENPNNTELWKRVRSTSNEELWRVCERSRERLVAFARKRLREQLSRRGENAKRIEAVGDVLDMEALTIGFARRFATYKRATLLFKDPERLIKILTNPERPVQLILAGKAHPKDEPGKRMIREVVHFARDERIRKHIVFLEDYDINVARHMVQGCDVWLNNPKPPMEASGTSGMKAAVNGVLNCSTFDGWWAEAFDPEIGWTIGHGETYEDSDYQDKVESELLYDMLEKEIVPLFYERDNSRCPRGWTETVKRMLEQTCPVFITTRMVSEYADEAYVPNHKRAKKLLADNCQRAKKLSHWQEEIKAEWNHIKIESVTVDDSSQHIVGDRVEVVAEVHLGKILPEDVKVEIYHGVVHADRELNGSERLPLKLNGELEEGTYSFKGEVVCSSSGVYGFSVRILPSNPDLKNELDLGLITWEE